MLYKNIVNAVLKYLVRLYLFFLAECEAQDSKNGAGTCLQARPSVVEVDLWPTKTAKPIIPNLRVRRSFTRRRIKDN